MSGNRLHDSTVDATHRITDAGQLLLQSLQAGTSYGSLLLLADRHKILTPVVVDMLGFLNLTGSLKRHRTWRAWVVATKLYLLGLLTGTHFPPLAWRSPISYSALCIGIAKSAWPVVFLATIIYITAMAAELITPLRGTAYYAASTGTFLISVYVHELAHVKVLQKEGIACDVICRGLRLGILHQRLDTTIEIRSAIIGPLFGVLMCGIAALCGFAFGVPLVSLSASIVMLVHIGSLLPWYGDGFSIRQALKQK